MHARTLKLKYTKNPETLIENPDVQSHLWDLEDAGELEKLPIPFLAYYVVGRRLTDEVNNGGLEQYLSNSSVHTLPYLEKCVNALGNAELTAICLDFLSAVSTYFDVNDTKTIAKADYSDELLDVLTDLEGRFYAFDEKYGVCKVAKKYYQSNIPAEKLVIEVVKPPENDKLRYFIYDKSGVTNEQAAKAFMDFLAEFSDVQFEICIVKWGGRFRICATDSTNSLNLAEICAHFDDSSYSFGKTVGSDRSKILGFKLGGGILKEMHVDSYDEENWVWRLTIVESGFDDNEYEISYHCCYSGGSNPNDRVSKIVVGDFAENPKVLAAIENVLVERAKVQGNVTRIFEQNCGIFFSKNKIKILYEK
ncbi:MAG: DUF4375 domain-containing protein [Candidatus Fimimonas sp.]